MSSRFRFDRSFWKDRCEMGFYSHAGRCFPRWHRFRPAVLQRSWCKGRRLDMPLPVHPARDAVPPVRGLPAIRRGIMMHSHRGNTACIGPE